jgi:hypothetical protein
MKYIFLLFYGLFPVGLIYAQPQIDSVQIVFQDIELHFHSEVNYGGGSSTQYSDDTILSNGIIRLSPVLKDSMSSGTLFLSSKSDPSADGWTTTTMYDSVSNVVDSFYYYDFEPWNGGIYGNHSHKMIHFVHSEMSISPNTREINLDSSGLKNGNFYYHYGGGGKTGSGSNYSYESQDFIGKIIPTSHVRIIFYNHVPQSSVKINGAHGSSLCIYPNPAAMTLSIVMPDASVPNPEIFDMLGRKLISFENSTLDLPLQINISSLPPGIYYLRAGNQMQKFVIKR